MYTEIFFSDERSIYLFLRKMLDLLSSTCIASNTQKQQSSLRMRLLGSPDFQ